MVIFDNIFVLPCLQEKRVLNENEQNGSIIKRNELYPNIKVTSSDYNNIWSGKDTNYLKSKGDQRVSLFPLNDSLDIYGFKKKGACKNISTFDKWKMYGKFLLNTTKQNNEDITSLFISHHNRLRGLKGEKYTDIESYKTIGGGKEYFIKFKNLIGASDNTLPLIPIIDHNLCDAYANNFCLKIKYSKETNSLSFDIVFPGFPDKGQLSFECEKPICNHNGCSMSGGSYEYCCNNFLSNINTSIIEAALLGYYNSNNDFIQGVFYGINKDINIYLIRHGNSLHNKPCNISGYLSLDSSLTYLGMYQAEILGKTLKQSYPNDFNLISGKDILLCSSFLSRSQLTGLCILKSIYGYNSLPLKLKDDYFLLSTVSKNRFQYLFKDINIFYKMKGNQIISFSPLDKYNIEDFYNFINTKIIVSSGSKKNTSKHKKLKKKSKKKKRKKNKKQLGGCSDIQDFWSKLHLYL